MNEDGERPRTPSFYDRVEAGFVALGRLTYRRAWWVIGVCLLIVAGLLSGLPLIEADFSSDSYLLPGDVTRERYDAFRDRFGLDERIVVGLEPKDVFDLDFLDTLARIHREIDAEVPYVEELTSLVNARNTRGEGDELIVEDLLERWPESEAALPALREQVLANPTYRNTLISEDARYTVILVRPQTYSSLNGEVELLAGFDDAVVGEAAGGEHDDVAPTEVRYLTATESDMLVSALYDVGERHASDELSIRLAGEIVLGHRAKEISWRDTSLFAILSLLMTVVVVYGLFRRISAALLPATLVVVSLGTTFGAMGLLGIPFSIPTQVLPNFLTAVAVCDSVHVLVIFFQSFDQGRSREDAIAHALGHSGLAIVLTSLTTAGGMLSFLAAEITPVARLGAIAPVGVMLALLFTVTLLPALLAVVPLSTKANARMRESEGDDADVRPTKALDRLMVGIGDRVTAHPQRVLVFALVLVLVAVTGVSRLRFAHDPFDWLFPDDPVRIAVHRMDEGLRGVSTVEVLVDTGRENGLYEPEVLKRLEAFGAHAMTIDDGRIQIGSVISIVDIVKEIHRALHGNDPAFYRLPDDRDLVAQELLLFENSGSDDLLQVTDSRFQVARLTLRVPLIDAFFYGAFLEQLEADLARILGPDLDFELTGATVLGSRTFSIVITSMARSYLLALAIITPLMMLIIGSVRIGLLSMIPNLLPVFFTLALMGWLDISLNMSTLLVGSVLIGLAVDDTIHFLHKFDRYYRRGDDPRVAVRRTLSSTGRALVATTIVLVLSFGIYSLGSMTGVVSFGLLAAFGAAVAFLADLTLSPALLVLVFGRKREGE